MKSVATARLKRARAVELLAEGCSYDEIARRVGFSHRGSAFKAVAKALDERIAEDVDTYRQVAYDRLNAVLAAHWDSMLGGDQRATSMVLRVVEMQVRLLGLDNRCANNAGQCQQLLVDPDRAQSHH